MNGRMFLRIGVAVLSAGCGNSSFASNARSNATAAATEMPTASTASPAQAPPSNETVQSPDRDSEARTIDTSLASVVGALKHDLVGSGSIDGQPITDVQRQSRCDTAFVTALGRTVIHWSKVGDFAARVEARTVTIPVDDGSGAHKITLPDGQTSRRVDGSLGLLADECEKAL